MNIKQTGVFRFAPSPSGFLHVGGARTAIFNWLLAKKVKGKFLLRIEDTDRKRSTTESIDQIKTGLAWLGLNWDEKPIYQSERIARHQQVADELLKHNKAYRCFCSTHVAKADGRIEYNKYSGRCRSLKQDQIDKYLQHKEAYTVRIKIQRGDTKYIDGVHGQTIVNNTDLDDFIILRSDGTPIYQLAVTVDDHDMGVTHVVRGDDHLLNTPKQIQIYTAMDWQVPQFSHLPLILAQDRTRLSKRHGASSVEEFHKQGILPEALFNFLCLLGWSPGDDREILSKDELIELFGLKKVNKANAIFDQQKLDWMNSRYLSQMSAKEIFDKLNSKFSEKQKHQLNGGFERFFYLLDLIKNRARTLDQIFIDIQFYFNDPTEYEEKGIKKYFSSPVSADYLGNLNELFTKEFEYSVENMELVLRNFADKSGVSAASIIHPLRLALTGKTASPGIFDIIYVLGRDKVLERIKNALNYINAIR